MNPVKQYILAPDSDPMRTTDALPSLLILAVFLTFAVYSELKAGRISNWLTIPGMGVGLFAAWLQGATALRSSLGGLAIGFGFLFVFYILGGVGGGDVKMMGAVGALMGVNLVKPALFYTTLIGAFLGIMICIWRKDFWLRCGWMFRRLAFWRASKLEPPPPLQPITVPYAMAIATGSLLALFDARSRLN